jgi:release factor H-coupled RctB family protein
MTAVVPDVIASAKTWIESSARDQLAQVAALPGMRRVVGMPDLHPGAGSPVGAAFLSESVIYPHLVGSDIGCGMGLWDTGLPLHKLKLDRLEKRLDLEGTGPHSRLSQLAAEQARATGYESSLGTLGGGNHFAELTRVDRVLDPRALRRLGGDPDDVWLLVHSGSRDLGHSINRQHVGRWGGRAIEPISEAGCTYLDAHDNAVRWARANRALIGERVLTTLGSLGPRLLDITHNSVSRVPGADGLWLHRKGAAPADAGPIIIPGSRGDLSYLVTPVGDGGRNLASLAHGAGRKWARAEARGKLGAKADAKALRRTRLGGRVICDDKDLLFEEAPQAYKPIATVVDALLEAGLIRVIAELAPVLTYKVRRTA